MPNETPPRHINRLLNKEGAVFHYLYKVTILLFLCLLSPPVIEYFRVIQQMTLFIFLFSITVSFVLTPWVRMLAHKMNALDTPSERKIHASPTPLLGGIAIFIACWGAILINSWPDDATKGILWGSLLIFGMGILDDMFQVSAKPKLLIQIIAAIIVVCSGMVITLFPKLSPWGMAANYIITLVWIVGLANALNFFDGMDGLAGGLAGIISLFLFVLACQRTQPVVGRLATALAGATLGFLPYNLKIKQGASIFLGDCGSAMLGFVLAALAVKGEWADNNPVVSLSAPLLIFGVLIFDLFYISIERVASKKVTNFSEWLKYTGKDHLHHRLEALLQSKLKSVLMIYLLSFTLGLGALALRYARTVEAVILIVQAVLILLIISILQIEGTKREKRK